MQLPCIFPSRSKVTRKKGKKKNGGIFSSQGVFLSPLASLRGGSFFLAGGLPSFQPFPLYESRVMTLSHHERLGDCPHFQAELPLWLIPKEGPLDGDGFVVWRQCVNQPICQSVNKSLFISVGAELPIRWLGHVVSLPAVSPPHTILHTTVSLTLSQTRF